MTRQPIMIAMNSTGAGADRRSDRSAGRHLSLAVSNDRKSVADRRTEYLARAYACGDMALRADDAADKTMLHAMALVWRVLARREPLRGTALTRDMRQ
jgi:hypothetical protein